MDIEATLNVIGLPGARGLAQPASALLRGVLELIQDDGTLIVSTAAGQRLVCEWLESGHSAGVSLAVGDGLLVAVPANGGTAVALGRVSRYRDPSEIGQVAHLHLRALDGVSITCGESSLEMRADGKVLIKGEDVTVRAKGTQRIRAGTVSIN
jgi:hypothetical protein